MHNRDNYLYDSDDESDEEEDRSCCCWCHVEPRTRHLARLQHALCRILVTISYAVFVVLAISRVHFVLTHSNDKHEMAWTIGGAFVVATVPISLHQIFQHLTHFVEPRQQTHVIRMISMVPLYAIQSWFSLRYPFLSLYTQCIREVYESYVLHAFVAYLVGYMGSEDELVAKLQNKPAILGKHMAPFCCLPPWSMGAEFLRNCRFGVLQYLGIRTATMILTFIFEPLGLYGEGEYSVKKGFFWITLINCCSQTLALYVLVLFYHATHKELIAINPLPKFASVKGVVFASWWQSLLIGLMVHQGTIGELDSHSAEMVAKAVQDLLICAEMLMAAIAFTFTFPLSDFVGAEAGYTGVAMPPGWPEVGEKAAGGGEASHGHGGHGHGGSSGAIEAGGAPEVLSVWSALWTSCVPLDVREEFREWCLDVRGQCREHEVTTMLPCTIRLPCMCRCRFRFGGHSSRSPRKAKLGLTPRVGSGIALDALPNAATTGPSVRGSQASTLASRAVRLPAPVDST